MFLDLYLEALDEELVTLCSPISTHRPTSAPKVEELGEDTQESQLRWESGTTRCANCSLSELGLTLLMSCILDTKRQVQSSRPSCPYSVAIPV